MLYAVGALRLRATTSSTVRWVAVAYYVRADRLDAAPPCRKVANAAERCTKRFLAADLTFALTGILLTPLADTHDRIADGGPTLPSIWTAGSVLGFAIKGGWRWAAFASDARRASPTSSSAARSPSDTVHNVLLVWVASIAIGYVVEVARASERTLARALEIEAATRERERLARDIHDSVLQVLAMVQRRGAALGGEAAELGRMAGEQEVALRTLVSSGLVPPRAAAVAQRPDDATASARRRRCDRLRRRPALRRRTRRAVRPARPARPARRIRAVTFAEPGAPVPLAAGGRGSWPPLSVPPWTMSAGTRATAPAPGSWSRTSRTR